MSGAISAYRRHHIERLKSRHRSMLRAEWSRLGDELANDPAFIGGLVTTHTRCSCPMCGNPRKWFGELTRQERLAEIDAYEQLAEIDAYEQRAHV